MELGDKTHLDYFLLSKWGSLEDELEITKRATDEANKIVASLSKRDNVSYRLARVKKLTKTQYNVLQEYATHYVDENLQIYLN